jgi:hypothetical protein
MVEQLSAMSLRSTTIGGTFLSLFFSIALILLSIKVNYEGWVYVVDVLLVSAIINVISCIYVSVINRPTFVFYVREICVDLSLGVLATYIWFACTWQQYMFAFWSCVFISLLCISATFYMYLNRHKDREKQQNSKHVKVIGAAAALGAASQGFMTEVGLIVLVSFSCSMLFLFVGVAMISMARKRRWGKSKGDWNEI